MGSNPKKVFDAIKVFGGLTGEDLKAAIQSFAAMVATELHKLQMAEQKKDGEK